MLQGRREDWKKQGIYCITCAINGKKYIGSTKNIYRRINLHKCKLNKNDLKHNNQYFIDDWNKYGYENFNYYVLEYTEENLKDKETYYIELYDTINREKGYNLRRDKTGIGMIPLDETRQRYSEAMKRRFSKPEEKEKISNFFKQFWKENEDIKQQMLDKVSKQNTKYYILQYTKEGKFVKRWETVRDILKENPTYKRHNIYAVCSGEKPSMYGFKWTKELN